MTMDYRAAAKELSTLRRDLWITSQQMGQHQTQHQDVWNGRWLMEQHRRLTAGGRDRFMVPEGVYLINEPLVLPYGEAEAQAHPL